jgi:hypothetical protein
MDFIDNCHSPVAGLAAWEYRDVDARRPSRNIAGYGWKIASVGLSPSDPGR